MLRNIMKQRNLTQAKVARLSNINQTQFNRAYNGYQQFFPEWRKRISKALNLSEEELFPDYKKKENEENGKKIIIK